MDVPTIVIVFVGMMFSLVIHELAHAVSALYLGDDTAKRLGRITLNPIPHIDPMMSIVVPALCLYFSGGNSAFGGAKPVPVDTRRLRKPRRDMMLVAIAGPISNVLLAVVCAFTCNLTAVLASRFPDIAERAFDISAHLLVINLTLAMFNMLPIPPLDGSRVLAYFLPADLAIEDPRMQQQGLILVMILSLTGGFAMLAKPLGTAAQFLLEWTHLPFAWF